MQQNILRESNITKIYLNYTDNGLKQKFLVDLRFMDKKECYFAVPFVPNFTKPKKKTEAELVVYTPDGIYKTNVSILDVNMSMQDVLYQVTIPQTWQFIQLRQSSRKVVSIPVTIKYNDGYKISAVSYDIALGGVSFYSKEPISSIYKRLPCIVELEIPGGKYVNIEGFNILAEGKFVREKEGSDEHFGEVLYIYKFNCTNKDAQYNLKNYLITLD